jgi:hypothetical protein
MDRVCERSCARIVAEGIMHITTKPQTRIERSMCLPKFRIRFPAILFLPFRLSCFLGDEQITSPEKEHSSADYSAAEPLLLSTLSAMGL